MFNLILQGLVDKFGPDEKLGWVGDELFEELFEKRGVLLMLDLDGGDVQGELTVDVS